MKVFTEYPPYKSYFPPSSSKSKSALTPSTSTLNCAAISAATTAASSSAATALLSAGESVLSSALFLFLLGGRVLSLRPRPRPFRGTLRRRRSSYSYRTSLSSMTREPSSNAFLKHQFYIVVSSSSYIKGWLNNDRLSYNLTLYCFYLPL